MCDVKTLSRMKRIVKFVCSAHLSSNDSVVEAIARTPKSRVLIPPNGDPLQGDLFMTSRRVACEIRADEVWDAFIQHQCADRPRQCDRVNGTVWPSQGFEYVSQYETPKGVAMWLVTSSCGRIPTAVLPD